MDLFFCTWQRRRTVTGDHEETTVPSIKSLSQSLSHSTFSRIFPAVKLQETLFQVGSLSSIQPDIDAPGRHYKNGCNHTFWSLRFLEYAYWLSHRSSIVSKFHRPSIPWVKFHLTNQKSPSTPWYVELILQICL